MILLMVSLAVNPMAVVKWNPGLVPWDGWEVGFTWDGKMTRLLYFLL